MKLSIPLVVGNWKMHPVTVVDATHLAAAVVRTHRKLPDVAIAIAPPFLYVADVAKKIKKSQVMLAAQDVYHEPVGPFTGEISVPQLKDFGVSYVIVGHSERRAMGETNELVAAKVAAVLKHRLTPIVCIGERERDGAGNFFGSVEGQLRSLGTKLSAAEMRRTVIAYEPIWAIGTGNTATAADVKEMQLFIERTLTKLYDRATARKVRLLYGGSVKPTNAAVLHSEGGMQGFLVGGASLRVDDFAAISKAVS